MKNMKNKKIILRVAMLLCLFGFAIACKDDNVNPSKPKPSNPLVGEWYTFQSTDNNGIKVIFTDSTVTAFEYIVNHPVWGTEDDVKWFDNIPYIFENDTITLDKFVFTSQEELVPFQTKVVFFTKNTIRIQYFIPTGKDGGWPSSYTFAELYRSYK